MSHAMLGYYIHDLGSQFIIDLPSGLDGTVGQIVYPTPPIGTATLIAVSLVSFP